MNRCKRCQLRAEITLDEFINEPIYLCPRCAEKFIQKLAEWKDFDLEEEVLQFCKSF